ncbi:hypothetical protein ACPOL_0112 [Acidisarcina polymorpha]|uniref:Uncharacterized protein n=1 Tax=Acidisarcina polymorpha TaxID=2211140 RepID=A0A2Z5FS03_9BACT|nr:hypothetical protein ACPOL_0112 [Acidisarcina polymorpha]
MEQAGPEPTVAENPAKYRRLAGRTRKTLAHDGQAAAGVPAQSKA